MQKCDCYHTELHRRYTYNPITGAPIGHDVEVGVCWGTRECEECSCGGDETKCDFYPDVRKNGRKKKKPKFGEWISVEDRLPNPRDKDSNWTETVLFLTTQGYIYSGYGYKEQVKTSFSPSYWLDESEKFSFEDTDVTHWMPLPEPPKGE